MKNIFIFLLFICSSSGALAQLNPASSIRDTSLSLPEKSFEVFWQTFEDNYAFFQLRHIDWKATYQKYRHRVNSQTSEDSLFSILSEMVAPFQDDHINIIIPGKRQYTVEKPSLFLKEFPADSSRNLFWKAVDTTLYKSGFDRMKGIGPQYSGKQLFYYTRSNDYGYVRVSRCFVSDETYDDAKADALLAGKLFDAVLQQLGRVKALMIDARVNIGGNDEFAYALAGRFVSKKVLGHAKQTRKGGYEEFTPLENFYIIPQSKEPFLKPVVLLTNDQTASAGDVLAMIMKALPQTTLIGENSLGIYSDMYGFELPNKWQVSLSNQRYYSADMVCYEGMGTPVDIRISNTKQDVERMQDVVVSEAIKYLEEKLVSKSGQ